MAYVEERGTTVYHRNDMSSGTPSGYLGVTGPTAYVELGGENGAILEGSANDAPVDGQVTDGGNVCVAGTQVS